MPDDKPLIQVDTDWKKQAQEEKRRLAEQERQTATTTAPASAAMPPPPGAPASRPGPAGTGRGAARDARALPQASFATLVQSILTQTMFYLGEMAARGTEPSINLDMAKHQIDTLGVIEDKTRNNLSEDEKRMLDQVLYEVRTRYVNVASQYIV